MKMSEMLGRRIKEDPKDAALLAQKKYDSYIEYGRRFEKLLAECRKKAVEAN